MYNAMPSYALLTLPDMHGGMYAPHHDTLYTTALGMVGVTTTADATV
jgi:hypothetical protein